MDVQIKELKPENPLPNHLLLLGDENQDLIDAYLPFCERYALLSEQVIRGICLLKPEGKTGEIMNIAVEPAYQGRGFGQALLRYVIEVARQRSFQSLVIKTGNSGIGQIALYQRLGFDLVAVNFDYFLHTYPNPIWENGIQCKHQLVFERVL
ncbi:GNAT family N-acetyltransferase [Larkinella ripae]